MFTCWPRALCAGSSSDRRWNTPARCIPVGVAEPCRWSPVGGRPLLRGVGACCCCDCPPAPRCPVPLADAPAGSPAAAPGADEVGSLSERGGRGPGMDRESRP